MGPSSSLSIRVEDPSGVGEARRTSARLAKSSGLPDAATAKLALVVTELATNLLKHTRAGCGEIVLRHMDGSPAIEVLAIDAGPGIPDVPMALRDHYSTAGTGGGGLGAIRRLADQFDIHTDVVRGTVIRAVVGAASAGGLESGGVCIAKRGEPVPGDGWALLGAAEAPVRRVIVTDGVGHGAHAAAASEAAIRLASTHPEAPLGDLLGLLHAALRGSRGAAVAVVDLDAGSEQVQFAGIGNITAVISVPAAAGRYAQRNLVSHPGTVGHELHRVQEFRYDWPVGSTLVLHSDGAKARWSLEDYPGLSRRHPAIVAGVIYRDFNRGTDDITVVALRAATR